MEPTDTLRENTFPSFRAIPCNPAAAAQTIRQQSTTSFIDDDVDAGSCAAAIYVLRATAVSQPLSFIDDDVDAG